MIVVIIILAIAVCLGIGMSRVLFTSKKPLVINEWMIIGVVGAVVILIAVSSGRW